MDYTIQNVLLNYEKTKTYYELYNVKYLFNYTVQKYILNCLINIFRS